MFVRFGRKRLGAMSYSNRSRRSFSSFGQCAASLNIREFRLKSLRIVTNKYFYSPKRLLSNAAREGWLPDLVPNPKSEPKVAGRPGVHRSNICDPDKILSTESQNIIEGIINKCQFEAAVLVIRRMDASYTARSATAMMAAEVFAKRVLDRWQIGDRDKNDGVLIFLAVENRVVYIATGEAHNDRFGFGVLESVIEDMKPYLKASDYGAALEYAMLSIDNIYKSDSHSKTGDSRSNNARNISFLAMSSMMLFGLYIYFTSRRRMNKCKETFPRVYDSNDTSCPYCLEAYSDENEGRVIMECGHSFCKRCVNELLKVGGDEMGTCVICAEPFKLKREDEPFEALITTQTTEITDSSDKIDTAYRVERFLDLFSDVIEAVDLDDLVKTVMIDRHIGGSSAKASVERQLRDFRVRQQMESGARENNRCAGTEGSSRDKSFGGGNSKGGSGAGGSW